MSDHSISNLASPLNYRALAHLRNRSLNEDPLHQGAAIDGKRTVWYKMDKTAVIAPIGANQLLEIVRQCFANEGLNPEARLLAGAAEDNQYTLSFAFPHDKSDAVNAAVAKINDASRRQQQKMAQGVRGI